MNTTTTKKTTTTSKTWRRIAMAAGAALIATLMLPAAPARADGNGELALALAQHIGHSVDLRNNYEIKRQLYERGLIPLSANSIRVTAELLERVVGNERLFNEIRDIRYRVGDRVFVTEQGNLNVRGEIVGINADGTYQVKIWDRVASISPPNLGQPVDPVSGRSVAGTPPTRIRFPDGREETRDNPWNERVNERVVTIDHATLDRNNGLVDPGVGGREYVINGYVVNIAEDAVLRERVNAAMRAIDRLVGDGRLDLTLPVDEAAREQKLDKLAAMQTALIVEIFKSNPMGYLRGADAQARWSAMHSDPEMKLNGRMKIGGVLKYAVGVCTDQTAALAAVMREVGRRVGFDVRVIHGATIDGGGHNFMTVRLANGRRFIMDPSWHGQDAQSAPWSALENIDFATFDQRWWSNREINRWGEEISRQIEFTAPGSPERAALERALNDGIVERLLAAEVTERLARESNADRDRVIREVLEARVGNGAEQLRHQGTIDALRSAVGQHVDAFRAAAQARGASNGFVDMLDSNSRAADRLAERGARGRARRGRR